jgi:hypothetical protein
VNKETERQDRALLEHPNVANLRQEERIAELHERVVKARKELASAGAWLLHAIKPTHEELELAQDIIDDAQRDGPDAYRLDSESADWDAVLAEAILDKREQTGKHRQGGSGD